MRFPAVLERKFTPGVVWMEGAVARNDSLEPGGFLVAFVAGAAVGAAVALLFAPAPGEEARQYQPQRARERRDRAAEAARHGREAIKRRRGGLRVLDRAREQQAVSPEGQEA